MRGEHAAPLTDDGAQEITTEGERFHVELICSNSHADIRVWHRTKEHRAVMLSPGTANVLGARVGLEFQNDHGEVVMVFPGANDAIIVTAV